MASMWRRAMLYLGLGPDDEYDDYDPLDRARRSRRCAPPAPGGAAATRAAPPPMRREPEPEIVPLGPHDRHRSRCGRRRWPTVAIRPPGPAPRWCARCSRSSSAKPYVVAPTSFNHAQEVADKLKVNQPVIVNLQNVDRDLSRRIIDFASGLCYGVGGQMERVANQVFLLTPSNVEVSAEERRRLQEHGYGEG